MSSTAANGPTTVPQLSSAPIPVFAWSPKKLPTFVSPVPVRRPPTRTDTGE